MVETIIEKEPQQVNAKGYNGTTPLHNCAASNKQNIEKAELLVKRGANVNQKINSGWNVLHHASCDGTLDCVKLFTERY